MPSPIPPSDFKTLIPSAGGSFCDKFMKVLKTFPYRFWQWYSYVYQENGEFTDDYKADICALACAGGTPTPIGSLAAPVVTATDGSFNDKVHVSWNSVAGATSYEVYRATIDNSQAASLVGTVTEPIWDDTMMAIGTFYWYYVKAKNAAQVSALSVGDRGHAAAAPLIVAPVTNLRASQGFGYYYFPPTTGYNVQKFVTLNFVPVPGATSYSIYRGTTNIFADAELIDANRTPFDNTFTSNTGPTPTFINNGTELVYQNVVPEPSKYTHFFYWVIAKNGTVESPEAGPVEGWSDGPATPDTISALDYLMSPEEIPVHAGATECYFVLRGSFASGAGSTPTVGGGGGGSGPIITGRFAVAAAGKVRVRSNTEVDPVGGPSTSGVPLAGALDGDPGPITYLEYSALGDWSDTVIMAEAAAPGAGTWLSGGGVGGAGSTGTVHALVTEEVIRPGFAGMNSNGNYGGRSGYIDGHSRRHISANVGGDSEWFSPGAGGSNGGGLGRGGHGKRGWASISWIT